MENFSIYTPNELFYYLIDNLIIPSDEELDNWVYYKETMLELAQDFEKRQYERFRMEETE